MQRVQSAKSAWWADHFVTLLDLGQDTLRPRVTQVFVQTWQEEVFYTTGSQKTYPTGSQFYTED